MDLPWLPLLPVHIRMMIYEARMCVFFGGGVSCTALMGVGRCGGDGYDVCDDFWRAKRVTPYIYVGGSTPMNLRIFR